MYDLYSRFSSPERKRICRDVEVQTSPSRMQECVKDYLKKTLGQEVEQWFSKELTNVSSNKLPNIAYLKQICNSKVNIDYERQNDTFHKIIRTQDSDKENVINTANHSDGCIDSDFILGTEDTKTEIRNQQYQFDCHNPKLNISLNIDEDMIAGTIDEVDPDAITQPYYKTPVVPKQVLKTSVQQMYSAVSNPTDSELKKVNDIFLKSDTIDPGITPVMTTPFNDSGIIQLEKSSEKVNLVEERVNKSQQLKEHKRRSRRQLDFVEDSKSMDTDMFDASPESVHSQMEQANVSSFLDTR